MSIKKSFADCIADLVAAIPVVDEQEMYFLSQERDGIEEDFAIFARIKLTDLNIVFTITDNRKEVYVTVTDGPVEKIADILGALQQGFPGTRTDWGDVLELKNQFLQDNGVYGLFFSRVRFYNMFEEIPDTFEFESRLYLIKAVLFLSKEETDLFDKDEDSFYDIFNKKDVVKFQQPSR